MLILLNLYASLKVVKFDEIISELVEFWNKLILEILAQFKFVSQGLHVYDYIWWHIKLITSHH